MHSLFTFILITQDLNKIKKRPRHAFVDIGQLETCAEFQQKILNCSVVEARHSNFETHIWFLEKNRALSKFLYGNCIT